MNLKDRLLCLGGEWFRGLWGRDRSLLLRRLLGEVPDGPLGEVLVLGDDRESRLSILRF